MFKTCAVQLVASGGCLSTVGTGGPEVLQQREKNRAKSRELLQEAGEGPEGPEGGGVVQADVVGENKMQLGNVDLTFCASMYVICSN